MNHHYRNFVFPSIQSFKGVHYKNYLLLTSRVLRGKMERKIAGFPTSLGTCVRVHVNLQVKVVSILFSPACAYSFQVAIFYKV